MVSLKIISLCLTSTLALRISDEHAKQFLARTKRHNSHMFEETGASDYIGECVEEFCSFEEFVEAKENSYPESRAARMDQFNTDYDKMRNPCTYKNCMVGNTEVCINKWRTATCNCNSGWGGELCADDIDECQEDSNICGNGTCLNNLGSYECNCNSGWEGDNCENDINECLTDICGLNGNCENSEGSYSCICDTGFQGQHCDEDINECELNENICDNANMKCVNTFGSYECPCFGGYTGDLCEDDLDECTFNVCPSGSICTTPEFNMFECVCPEEGCF